MRPQLGAVNLLRSTNDFRLRGSVLHCPDSVAGVRRALHPRNQSLSDDRAGHRCIVILFAK